MAKKIDTKSVIGIEPVKPLTGLVTITAAENSKYLKGDYTVSAELAQTLIAKGEAKLK